jgi:hypothetical protein
MLVERGCLIVEIEALQIPPQESRKLASVKEAFYFLRNEYDGAQISEHAPKANGQNY